MIQSLNLYFEGSRATIAPHINVNNPLGSVLIQRIFTYAKGIFNLFRHDAHYTLPMTIYEYQNSA